MKKSLGVLLAGLLLTFTLSFTQLVTSNSWSTSYDSPEDDVYSLAVYNNKLYAGTGANGKIYVFDGSSWSENYDSPEARIYSLAVYGSKLYAGTASGGKIYVFDGSTWSENYDSPESSVQSLAVYNDKLYAGTGSNGKIYVFDGSTWSENYDSPESYVYSLAVYGSKLYAGTGANGRIYVFDGSSWSVSYDGYWNDTRSLVVYNNRLYADGGQYGEIYVFDGSDWSLSYDTDESNIYSLEVFGSKLYAGGSSEGKIFVFDGSTWSTSHDSSEVVIYSLEVYNDKLYAGTGPNGVILTYEEVAFDFSVSASPDNLTLARSDSTTSTITINLVSGTAQTVSLSGAWVTAPTGVSASFSPSSGTPTFSSTLTLTTTSTASAGNFTYRVTGSGGGLTRTDEIAVVIAAPPSVPSLVSPGNGTSIDTLTPTFDWSDVAGAESYTLEIATDNNFSNIVRTKSATESTATLSETEKLSYGTHYYWRVRGTSDFGTGDWSPTWSVTAKLAVPKVTNFEISAGATYTNSTGVQLTIAAQNAFEMSFSSDGVVWGEWESFQNSESYTLSAGDGPKNVYIRVKDNVGDISQISVDSITLDKTSPSTSHSLSGDLGAKGYKSSVVVTLTSTDVTSGVESTKYRIDSGEWRTGDTFVISEDGEHTVEYYTTDKAGNTEGTKTFEVTVYTPTAIPPILSEYWWAILSIIVVAVIVSTFVTQRVRLASRLKRITREKEEISKLKREAETKYFRDGSISRETYDTLVKDYERRKAELEKEERVLRTKVKRKAKGSKS